MTVRHVPTVVQVEGTIHQRESSPMTTPPGDLHLGSVGCAGRLTTQAAVPDRIRVQHARENDNPVVGGTSVQAAGTSAPAK